MYLEKLNKRLLDLSVSIYIKVARFMAYNVLGFYIKRFVFNIGLFAVVCFIAKLTSPYVLFIGAIAATGFYILQMRFKQRARPLLIRFVYLWITSMLALGANNSLAGFEVSALVAACFMALLDFMELKHERGVKTSSIFDLKNPSPPPMPRPKAPDVEWPRE